MLLESLLMKKTLLFILLTGASLLSGCITVDRRDNYHDQRRDRYEECRRHYDAGYCDSRRN